MAAAQQNFPRRFEGRAVLVTGAGTGFGAEIAVRAAQEGAQVVVHYNRSREGAEQTAKRIEQAGSRAALVQADITSWDQIRAIADAAFAAFGWLDVAVNNVGDVARDQMSWRDITEESIDHVLAVDIKGTLLCTQEDPLAVIDEAVTHAPGHRPSMLQDVLARRPTEIDVLNGGIVRGGRQAGVPVPLNQAVTALINGLEQSWTQAGAGARE